MTDAMAHSQGHRPRRILKKENAPGKKSKCSGSGKALYVTGQLSRYFLSITDLYYSNGYSDTPFVPNNIPGIDRDGHKEVPGGYICERGGNFRLQVSAGPDDRRLMEMAI